jgi:DNA-binding transcriptional MerR regulator
METLRRLAPYRTYTIGQLCREFGCTARALRFYEEQGLLEPTRRDAQRIYSHRDRTRLGLIVRGRKVGLSLREIGQLFDAYDTSGEAAQNALALRLFEQRTAALQAERDAVDEAIRTLDAASRILATNHPVERAA